LNLRQRGDFKRLLLAQAVIYGACFVWANFLAVLIFKLGLGSGVFVSFWVDHGLSGLLAAVGISVLTPLIAFYQLQLWFYRKIASGKLPRDSYITHLRVHCCIFAALLMFTLPVLQFLVIFPLVFHIAVPHAIPVALFSQSISFMPLLLALFILTQKYYAVIGWDEFGYDPFLYRRVLKLVKESDDTLAGLRKFSDSELSAVFFYCP